MFAHAGVRPAKDGHQRMFVGLAGGKRRGRGSRLRRFGSLGQMIGRPQSGVAWRGRSVGAESGSAAGC